MLKSNLKLVYICSILCSALLLVGCGQSGPLYLPEDQPSQQAAS
ncbi:MAG TPA: lipoprotein [Gammaproteobacteria bacterium]|nr:lipoprotein [Gammaproteobacteria bacterium]